MVVTAGDMMQCPSVGLFSMLHVRISGIRENQLPEFGTLWKPQFT